MKKLVITSLLVVAAVAAGIADYKAGIDERWNWPLLLVSIGAVAVAAIVVCTPESERWHI